jgi:hypothetical protein
MAAAIKLAAAVNRRSGGTKPRKTPGLGGIAQRSMLNAAQPAGATRFKRSEISTARWTAWRPIIMLR